MHTHCQSFILYWLFSRLNENRVGHTPPQESRARPTDHSNLKKFRPITNLSTISKIIERLVSTRLNQMIIMLPNFCQLQSAYRQGHSTESALNKILNDLLCDIDGGSIVTVMNLDISADSDAVDRIALIQRLETEFGISGLCRQCIGGYEGTNDLTSPSYSVHVGPSTPSITEATSGVPQGSVLRPLLYIAYLSVDWSVVTTSSSTSMLTTFSITRDCYLIVARRSDSTVHGQYTTLVLVKRSTTWSRKDIHYVFRRMSSPTAVLFTVFRRRRQCQCRDLKQVACVGVTLDGCLSMDIDVNEILKSCSFTCTHSDTSFCLLREKWLTA